MDIIRPSKHGRTCKKERKHIWDIKQDSKLSFHFSNSNEIVSLSQTNKIHLYIFIIINKIFYKISVFIFLIKWLTLYVIFKHFNLQENNKSQAQGSFTGIKGANRRTKSRMTKSHQELNEINKGKGMDTFHIFYLFSRCFHMIFPFH